MYDIFGNVYLTFAVGTESASEWNAVKTYEINKLYFIQYTCMGKVIFKKKYTVWFHNVLV
jgi:hypothetical protein